MLKMRRPKSISTAKVSLQVLAWAMAASPALAQQPAPIGHTSAKEVQVSGAVEVHDGEMLLGNGSAITAGTQTVNIALTRGGQLRLCSTTAVHLSHDRTVDAPESSALMIALERGAIETDYETGKYSDVLLTPDLRILISPPGHADISIRLNSRGDTCIDNHGANAPYITVTSQFDGGLYRLNPNQHVTFERGSLHDVVDTEHEPCGCPVTPPVSVASAGTPSNDAAAPGKPVGGPSSTPADTTFPLAESEGLAPPPPQPTTPVAKPGEVHAQVTVPMVYNGEAPPVVPGDAANSSAATTGAAGTGTSTTNYQSPANGNSTAAPHTTAHSDASTAIASAPPAAPTPAPAAPAKTQPGIFHRLGHFFSRIFGG
jgi:hypothetical protein